MSQRNRRNENRNNNHGNHNGQLEGIKLEMIKNAAPVAKAWSELSIALLEKTTELVKKSEKPEDVTAAMSPIFDLWEEATNLFGQIREISNPSHHDHRSTN